MSKWENWEMETEYLHPVFEDQIKRYGKVFIYTNIDHVSQSGMSARVSAFVINIDDQNGKPYIKCIAREVKVSGCGFDRGHHLAYTLFHKVYEYGEPEYQKRMEHISM